MAKILPRRSLGIDYGSARIGLALSDERKIIASPLLTLKGECKVEKTVEKLMAELEKHQKEHQYVIDEIIIGMPLLMSGKVGLIADEVKHFIEVLKQHTCINIITWDERLTSVQADRSLRESAMTRKKRSKVVDIVSAAILLQSYLDTRGPETTPIVSV